MGMIGHCDKCGRMAPLTITEKDVTVCYKCYKKSQPIEEHILGTVEEMLEMLQEFDECAKYEDKLLFEKFEKYHLTSSQTPIKCSPKENICVSMR
jgi:hypothetical protein